MNVKLKEYTNTGTGLHSAYHVYSKEEIKSLKKWGKAMFGFYDAVSNILGPLFLLLWSIIALLVSLIIIAGLVRILLLLINPSRLSRHNSAYRHSNLADFRHVITKEMASGEK